jgi:hypothetical protein
VTGKQAACVSTVLRQPETTNSVSCTYAMFNSAASPWCAAATRALNGKAPFPPREICYNRNIVIPDLPAGWSTIMRPNLMPETVYVMNGPNAGPVEIDSTVGGRAANDGRQITMAGNRFSYGLGVRATSEVRVTYRRQCWAMVASVGVDDEQNGWGVGEFVVRSQSLTQTVLANSTRLNGNTFLKAGSEPIQMTVANIHTLLGIRLQATRPWGGTYRIGNIVNDHLNWGDIRFLCGPDAPYLPEVSASITYANGTGPTKRAKVGDTVLFQGSATDWTGKAIAPNTFEWFVNLVHCQGPLCHTHFVQQIPTQEGLPSVAGGQLLIEDHPLDGGQYFYMQIRLAATDMCGRRNYIDKNIIVDRTA